MSELENEYKDKHKEIFLNIPINDNLRIRLKVAAAQSKMPLKEYALMLLEEHCEQVIPNETI